MPRALNCPNTEYRDRMAGRLRQIRHDTQESGVLPHLARMALIRHWREHNGCNAMPPKLTGFNIREQIHAAVETLVDLKSLVCPPLPCGADDHWYEAQEYNEAALAARLTELISFEARLHRMNQPFTNLHAFDEAYYGSDDD